MMFLGYCFGAGLGVAVGYFLGYRAAIRYCTRALPEVDAEMAAGALQAIHELLDSGGIPRGTFADDHVRNLVALYNQRGAEIAAIKELSA